MYATVRLGGSPGARTDDRLRRMKSRQLGIAAGIFADASGEDDARAGQTVAGLVEQFADLRRHRSTPSRRISPISAVGFR